MESSRIVFVVYAFVFLTSLSDCTKTLCPELWSVGWSRGNCRCPRETWGCSTYGGACNNKYIKLSPYCFDRKGCYFSACVDNCDDLYHLNGSRLCMAECPKGYYEEITQTGLCLQCHDDCDGCFGPSETDCSACRFARLGRSCVSECPVGYVRDTAARATCIKPDDCPGYILNSSCVEQCPSGFYPVNSADPPNCAMCNPLCKTCSGPAAFQCLTCSELRYGADCLSTCPDEAPFIYNQECLTECPAGKGCHTKCGDLLLWNNTCVEECPSSEPFSQMRVCQKACPRFQHEKNCVHTCPRGTYQDGKVCVGQCPSDKFTDEWSCVNECKHVSFGHRCQAQCPGKMPHINGTCVQGCPESLPYVNPEDNSCVEKCPHVLFREQCVLQCPNNFFMSEDGVCALCDRMCQGCHGHSPRNCTLCKFFNSSGTCVGKCPEHSYLYEKNCFDKCPLGTVVLAEDKRCLTVCPNSYFNSSGTCVGKCPEHSYLYEKSCLDNCPLGTVVLAEDKRCLTVCPNSYYNNSGTCVKHCPSYIFKKACFDRCPPETFTIGENKTCVKCPKELPFSFNHSCLAVCPDDSPYHRKGSSTCLDKCPTHTTHLPGERVCREIRGSQVTKKCSGLLRRLSIDESRCVCPDYTAKCKRGSASCNDLYIKIPEDCWNGENSWCEVGDCLSSCGRLYNIYGSRLCLTKCPHGYYANSDRRLCLTCHPLCDSCYGPLKSHCSTCRFASLGTTCVSKCPEGYLNPKTKRCTALCPYIVFNQQCLLRCPHGYFVSGKSCNRCDTNCETCHGPGISNCDSCRNFTNNGKCVEQCPKYTSENMCVEKCPDGTSLYRPGKACLKLCPEDLPFSFRQTCSKSCPAESPFHKEGKQHCLSGCPEFTAHLPEDEVCRDWCPRLKPKKLNGLCVEKCPPFQNMSYLETCLMSCPVKTIIQAGTNVCIPCPPDHFLYYENCVSKCPWLSASEGQKCHPNFLMPAVWFTIAFFFSSSLYLYKKRIIDSKKKPRTPRQETNKELQTNDVVENETPEGTGTGGAVSLSSDLSNIACNNTESLQVEPKRRTAANPNQDCADDVVPDSGHFPSTRMGQATLKSDKKTSYVAQETTTAPVTDASATGQTAVRCLTTSWKSHQEQTRGTLDLFSDAQHGCPSPMGFLSDASLPWPSGHVQQSACPGAELWLPSYGNDANEFGPRSPVLLQAPATDICMRRGQAVGNTTDECLKAICKPRGLQNNTPVGEFPTVSSVESGEGRRHTEQDIFCGNTRMTEQSETNEFCNCTSIQQNEDVNIFMDRNTPRAMLSTETFKPNREQLISKNNFSELDQIKRLTHGDTANLVNFTSDHAKAAFHRHDNDLDETFV